MDDYKQVLRQRRLTMEEKVAIVTDYRAGIPTPDIMKKHNVSRTTIYRALHTVVQKEGAN
jgi:transposase